MASKQVVGWQVGATMPEELVTRALQRAFWAQPPTPGLLVHSDQGGQYCTNAYRQLLHDNQALRVVAESSQRLLRQRAGGKLAQGFGRLWSRFKTEVLEVHERPVFADLADAQRSVADYFDYYNHKRLHARIDYQTPYHTHQQLLQFSALNCPA